MFNKFKYGRILINEINKSDFTEFLNEDEIDEWAKENYGCWIEEYSKDDLSIPIKQYCGYLYKKINYCLRFGLNNTSGNYINLIKRLNKILIDAPRLNKNIISYRKVDDVFIEELIKCNKKGFSFEEKGFMSTTLLKDEINNLSIGGNNVLKIYVRQGTIGAYVTPIVAQKEYEYLLRPGMYLTLISYPYYDRYISANIYECALTDEMILTKNKYKDSILKIRVFLCNLFNL